MRQVLRGPGIALDLGAVRARVRSQSPSFAAPFQRVYGAFEPEPSQGVFDATITLRPVRGIRRVVRRQVEVVVDGERLFEPFPAETHLPMVEWGLNYLIATRTNQHLLLHAGALEHLGVGILLPALPGSGKSTLTAALACHGYRLLSDEFGVVQLENHLLLPLLRPLALKNASIDVIARLAPDVRLGPRFDRTRKGTVAHLAPGRRAVRMRHVAAAPALILFPQFRAGARTTLQTIEPERAFAKLSVNSFNYRLLGEPAFDAVVALARHCVTQRLVYSDLVDAVRAIDDLVESLRTPLKRTGTG